MKKVSLAVMAATVVAISCGIMSSCTARSPKANLSTDVDSLSYAFGVSNAQGLDGYLMQMGIDSTMMSSFIRGLNEGVAIDPDDKKRLAQSMGFQIGQQMGSRQMLDNLNQRVFGADSTQQISRANLLAGFIAAANKKDLAMSETDAQTYVQTKSNEIRKNALEAQHAEKKAADLKFLEDNKNKEGVVTLRSGLQYKVVKEGTGPKPTATDIVKVDYVGTLISGDEFDSSVKRGQPAEFGVGQVIAGWTEGLQLMPVGSKYIFWIPYDLAYGEDGRPGSIEPFSTLIFEVDLLDIVKQ
ncbi:MAG: FKBP-type peptidyl-prolyl cis-trans isomerase [Alistipes sp.]|jgi:FKBP-type peptidyl-prolyl cis-trans isomerase FklB|nr:FKBP-type peptidyl-prolyl cis-trans isomerase [Alistipes sp.]